MYKTMYVTQLMSKARYVKNKLKLELFIFPLSSIILVNDKFLQTMPTRNLPIVL